MRVSLESKGFEQQMQNIVQYSMGFLDGVKKGKKAFLNNLGQGTIQALALYVDSSARGNPTALHHVYEWYQTGSPNARLFDLDYTVSNNGLTFSSKFKQSRTLKEDSNEPFYNKAYIMENGIPVTITPKRSSVLVFEEGGKTVFVKGSVTVRNPGGNNVERGFERTIDEFMLTYFKQSFLRASGIYEYINKPVLYKKHLKSGSKNGRSKGIDVGYKWIANAKVGVE
jgi:hypothetical protein